MARFRFRLQRLLDWKTVAEERSRMELGRIRGLVNRELGKRDSFLEEERHIREEIRARRSEMAADELLDYDRYRRSLRELVRQQDMVLETLREEERKAAERYLAARKEREMLESLRSVQKARHDLEEKRRGERVLNEIGVSMTVRRTVGDA